ncbi:MAG: radical SAM protein [Nitrospirae bacterium]|nr:radical SAM protein [Nitrospirota bacterium]
MRPPREINKKMRYSPFRHAPSIFRKNSPLHLAFFVTRRCNSKCPFCFYLAGGETDHLKNNNHGKERSDDELSLDEIEKISSSLGNLLWLAFSGGEIFLRDDIAEITEIFYENNKPAIILFPTNGLLTDVIIENLERILGVCKKSTIAVKLSIEGTEKLHDFIRGSGSFRKTMRTLTGLGRIYKKYPNLELGINTVFCRQNQDSMEKITDFVNRLENVTTHTISLIRGDVPDPAFKDIDINKYLVAVKKLEANLKGRDSKIYRFRGARLKAAQDILQRRLIHETFTRKKQMLPCYAGRLNLVLTERGDVYPCESFQKKMGNVRESGYDMKKIINSEKSKKIISLIRDKGCYCTHECYFMTNIMFNPMMYPSLLKEYFQL